MSSKKSARLFDENRISSPAIRPGEVSRSKDGSIPLLTYPHSCWLKYDQRDLKLRAMLESLR